MHLYLTKRSHLNTSYINEDGQILYKVQTPNKFVNRVATIKRVLPGDIRTHLCPSKEGNPPPYEVISDNDIKGDVEYDEVPNDVDEKETSEDDDDLALRDRFAHLAEIKFNTIASSKLRYHGEERETSTFFTKKEMGWYGRNRVFTGPDGLEYQWILGYRVPELVRRDAARTPVACFHRRRLGIIGKQRPASLEIFKEGMHMVDLIMVTFVYIQKIRNDGENAAHYHVYHSC